MSNKNKAIAQKKAARMLISELNVDYPRFQPRDTNLVNGHVEELVKLLERGATFDPLIIWRDEDGTVWVVEGHHRLEAYKRTRTKSKVRVVEVQGTEQQAKLLAAGENGKTRLSMSRAEKSQAAWSAFCSDPTTPAETIAMAGHVGRRTAFTMKKVHRWFSENELEIPRRWASAWFHYSKQGADQEDIDYDSDEYREMRKEQLHKRVGMALQKAAEYDPGLALEVISEAMGDNRFRTGCEFLGLFECEVNEYTGEIISLAKRADDVEDTPAPF